MKGLEIHIITRRQIPPELVEAFNRQTCKDFTLKVLTRYRQAWAVEDLSVDFPVELIQQKLFYSNGTRYALSLARNELDCYTDSKYVVELDDFTVMTPFSVEALLLHASEDFCMYGHRSLIHQTWQEYGLNRVFEVKREMGHGRPVFTDCPPRDFYIHGGHLFFPLSILKKINGWDLAFDGAWGGDDINIGIRVRLAGFKFGGLHSFGAYHFEHTRPSEERDDPPVGSGLYAYNRETGAKMRVEWPRGSYDRRCFEQNIFRAPQGLQEVCALLRR